MIDHVWTVVCANSIIDKQTNLVSLINAIEEFTIEEEPDPEKMLPVILDIFTLWVRSDFDQPASGIARISFITPSGKVLRKTNTKVDLTKYERLRMKGQYQGIPIPETGRYKFTVEFKMDSGKKWKTVAEIPLKITYRSKELKQPEKETLPIPK